MHDLSQNPKKGMLTTSLRLWSIRSQVKTSLNIRFFPLSVCTDPNLSPMMSYAGCVKGSIETELMLYPLYEMRVLHFIESVGFEYLSMLFCNTYCSGCESNVVLLKCFMLCYPLPKITLHKHGYTRFFGPVDRRFI